MAPGTYIGTGEQAPQRERGNKIVNRRLDYSARTGEGEIVQTANGEEYRVVLSDNAPNVIRDGHVYPR
jgi:hypothetical protein